MIQFGDEHGRHAVQGRAALLHHGLEHGLGLEGSAGEDHGGTVRHAAEHAHHHAEAMVERHRDAQAILGRESHALGAEETVVENIEVRQGGALG